jgi:hypothetical protein
MSMHRHLHSQLGLVLLLTASSVCAQPDSLPERSAHKLSDPDSALAAIHRFGSSFGETRSAIRAKLGAPLHSTVETSHSHYAAGMDSVIKWNYGSRSFSIIRVAFDTREILLKTEITNRLERLPAGIRIGRSTRKQIIASLGPLDRQEVIGDTVVLSFSPPNLVYEDIIDFYLVTGTLRKVRWWFYVD